MKRRQLLAASLFCFAAARASAARAGDEAPSVEGANTTGEPGETGEPVILPTPPPPDQQPPSGRERSVLETYYPPPVDGPELRLPESPTRLYLDGAYAPAGSLGSPLHLGERDELSLLARRCPPLAPFLVRSGDPVRAGHTLDVTMVPGGVPSPEKQTAVSFGDIRLGAIWTVRLAGEALVGGFGLRTRLATHTTHFGFYLPTNGELVSYVFPYYFYIEPTAILGGALGRFAYVINEGLVELTDRTATFWTWRWSYPRSSSGTRTWRSGTPRSIFSAPLSNSGATSR